MRAGREKRGLLRRRYRGSSATPTTPLPQIYMSIRQRRNWCRPLKRRKFVSSLLVADGSQGRPVQNYSAKSCKIATNAVVFINFCAYIFRTGIFDVHGVTGSSPVPRTIVKSPGISWVPGLFVVLPKYAFLGFDQMPLKVAKIAFSPGPAKAV